MSISCTSARAFLPDSGRREALRLAAQYCRGCELYRRATGTVFGEGSPGASLMLIGEAPDDRHRMRDELQQDLRTAQRAAMAFYRTS